MRDNKLLGTTTGTSMELPLEAFGSPGVQGELIIKAIFSDRDNDDPVRLNDLGVRQFEVKSKLSKDAPSSADLNGAFDASHGSSYLLIPDEVDHLIVNYEAGNIRLDVNDRHELSMASSMILAGHSSQARAIFTDMLTRYLDRMSYSARVPAYVSLTVVRDIGHEVQYIYMVAPPRPALVSSGSESLANEMKAIYALYREGLNATSPYYRVLCFHKIMEGLLGPLRTALRQRAKLTKSRIEGDKDKVPDHPDFPNGLRRYVGTPLKDFYDNFLSKQFRDAMAHFTLREKNALDVSSLRDVSRFTDVAFIANLCVILLIRKHEVALLQLQAAELGSKSGSSTT